MKYARYVAHVLQYLALNALTFNCKYRPTTPTYSHRHKTIFIRLRSNRILITIFILTL